MHARHAAWLGIALLTAVAQAAAASPDEPAFEISRVGAKSAEGGGVARLTLSAALAASWEEANVGFLALRSGGTQRSLDAASAHGRELDVALPVKGCSLLVADLGRSEDRGHPDSWRRSRRSVRAVFCQDTGDPSRDLAARGRAGALLLTGAGTRDEVRPLANPATTHPGSFLPLRVLADGSPAAGVPVTAEGPGGVSTVTTSDAHGVAVVSLTTAGAWRVYFHSAEGRIAELLFDVPSSQDAGGTP
jgi:hypothetical protein